ncbi:MAG: hypothetical protein KKG99_10215 [Bacteroidetes bacterium]|nr:hypothetical protein [Bacteroidota bacterium]
MRKFNALADPQYKMVGLTFAFIGVLLLIVQKLLNLTYDPGWEERTLLLIHYVIILSLIMLNFSKEIDDDERIQRIRYSLLKLIYAWTILGISFYLVCTGLNSVDLNMYLIIYIIEGMLVLYQILFRIYLALNPKWIFEEHRSARSFLIMGITILFLIGLVIFDMITFTV